MNVVGLITEYNPFHNGHLYHIQEAKKISKAEYVVVIMSGNFVQRGTPALLDKYQRTEMALKAGADLVIELPTVYATASAEFFAAGAVNILHKLGIVTHLCFGSECGDIHILSKIANLLLEENADYKLLLANFLKEGHSYPKARMLALTNLYPSIPTSILESPNNILGIEYMKALLMLKSSIIPITISRQVSNYHEEDLNTEIIAPTINTHILSQEIRNMDSPMSSDEVQTEFNISSATSIRRSILENNHINTLQSHLPPFVYHIMKESFLKTQPVYEDDFSILLNYQLMQETKQSLSKYSDITDELSNRIINTSSYCTSFSEFSKKLKSKHLTQTRINRALCHILLNIKQDYMKVFVNKNKDTWDFVSYARILGFKKTSSHLIRSITEMESISLISKIADARFKLCPLEYEMLLIDIHSSHLYNQVVYNKYKTILKDEYTRGIIRI